MAKALKVKELSPDGYSRFFILGDILNQIYASRRHKLRILDVGGGSEYMQQQLDAAGISYDLTVLDIIERPAHMKAMYIQGDATAMEFADNSFDIILSTDVLEHIPADRKQLFLDECLRVAAEVCIIAAPFETPGVNDAEVVVNEFNKTLFGAGQPWLEEHFSSGKPSRDMFFKTLRSKKIEYVDFGTQNLTTWLLNTQINLIDAKLGLSRPQHIAANQYYNENILEMNEFTGPTYRHFFVMYLSDNVKHFDARRYLTSEPDYAKTARYTNMLIRLQARRIAQLKSESEQLTNEAYRAGERRQEDLKRIHGLETIVVEQQRTLDELKPLLRVAQTPIIRKARSVLHRKDG